MYSLLLFSSNFLSYDFGEFAICMLFIVRSRTLALFLCFSFPFSPSSLFLSRCQRFALANSRPTHRQQEEEEAKAEEEEEEAES